MRIYHIDGLYAGRGVAASIGGLPGAQDGELLWATAWSSCIRIGHTRVRVAIVRGRCCAGSGGRGGLATLHRRIWWAGDHRRLRIYYIDGLDAGRGVAASVGSPPGAQDGELLDAIARHCLVRKSDAGVAVAIVRSGSCARSSWQCGLTALHRHVRRASNRRRLRIQYVDSLYASRRIPTGIGSGPSAVDRICLRAVARYDLVRKSNIRISIAVVCRSCPARGRRQDRLVAIHGKVRRTGYDWCLRIYYVNDLNTGSSIITSIRSEPGAQDSLLLGARARI